MLHVKLLHVDTKDLTCRLKILHASIDNKDVTRKDVTRKDVTRKDVTG